MDTNAQTEKRIGKGLLITTILFTLIFAGALIYYIAVRERWQLWAPIAGLMVISAAYSVRLFRFIKGESSDKVD